MATGALTNIALLLILYPEIIPMVDITLMGGAMGMGNTGPVQEFNIQARGPARYHLCGPTPIRHQRSDARAWCRCAAEWSPSSMSCLISCLRDLAGAYQPGGG